ncbi:uncharacterized protein EV420DRAFT_1268145 [Desarmillaria tabescens]|uniref:Protein kinase domain-containing protein n=1 Tax=Armillaria tabescens TaxID=1929756 RepID=A0AA39KFH4_ARMTA|nr:uncharacterized protein EV420DRAFT_1268145 [Desarmillaria tabescens]KAK0460229.1 hypothetical protein EV420DRAFT_1268145 [Desarmillaria tabescens]
MDTRQLPGVKVAGNKQRIWGATLYDFYWVQPIPQSPDILTRLGGSRLAAWAKEVGEVEHAKEEIECAEAEEHPREVFPCDVGRLLENRDPSIFTSRPLDHLDAFSYTESDEESEQYPDNKAYTFQQRIPFHLLPEKLIVHDDGDTLRVSNDDHRFSHRPPKRIHVYRLHLSSHVEEKTVAQRALVQKEHADANSEGGMLFVPSSLETPDPSLSCCATHDAEAIFAKFSKEPSPPLSTPEAHLYLSSERVIGRGHHSAVYSAEWEVPRTWLPSFRPSVCEQCVARVVLERFKNDMPDVEVDETEYIGKQISTFLIESAAAGLKHEGTNKTEMVYEGRMREIDVDVQWQGPGTYCEHERRRSNKTTFRTLVSAKLSIKHDKHLKQEAKNYQKFPAHFFQHWSGYNIVPTLQDPTPIGAVVPQFYGYYVPEKGDDDEGYLSPILLMEDCGTPIDIDTLDIDDRQECASLLFRFHREGWLHGSVYPRNIVVQHGDIEDWPAYRKHSDRRFRLIDFGRSEKAQKGDLMIESSTVQQMLKVGDCERVGKLGRPPGYGLPFLPWPWSKLSLRSQLSLPSAYG